MTNAIRTYLLPILFVLTIAAAALPASGQRRVTPVKSADPGTPPAPEAPAGPDLTRLVHMHDANGNVILVDTVTGQEVSDTTGLLPAPPKMEYPLIYTASAGVNIWDGLMRVFGQKYGLADVWGELNMHNRYMVSVTVGVGTASLTPAGKNFTFKAPVSPYFKIGAAYNFLYNSNPDYKLMIGVRYGVSRFRWSLENVRVDDPYWQESSVYSIPAAGHTTGWVEISLGLRVRIVSQLSMGWNIIYQSVLHDSASPHGLPMYIPGYGNRANPLSASLSVSWTFPLSERKKSVSAAVAPEPDAEYAPGDDADTSLSDSPSEIIEND